MSDSYIKIATIKEIQEPSNLNLTRVIEWMQHNNVYRLSELSKSGRIGLDDLAFKPSSNHVTV